MNLEDFARRGVAAEKAAKAVIAQAMAEEIEELAQKMRADFMGSIFRDPDLLPWDKISEANREHWRELARSEIARPTWEKIKARIQEALAMTL